MKVTMINAPLEPQRLIWTAARTCYSEQFPEDIWDEAEMILFDPCEDIYYPTRTDYEKLLNHLFKSGHHSVFEHLSFTFAVSGITRQTTHQLVRHRIASFSQQSMRYVNMKNAKFDVPEYHIHEYIFGDANTQSYRSTTLSSLQATVYDSLIGRGEKPEDARRVLPIGTKTNIVFTMNLRSLMNFLGERRCILAQGEIRKLATKVMFIMKEYDETLARMLMIKCQKLGYCPEERNKGNKLCSIKIHIDDTDIKPMEVIKWD